MERETTRKGAPRNRRDAETAWAKCWENLSQEQIQEWIERIPRHIQEVIDREGSNEYREGKAGGDIRPYDSEERRRRYQVYELPVVSEEDDDSDDEVLELDGELDGEINAEID